MADKKKNWLFYALITMVTWGIWGAFSSTPDYPATLTYVVWAISMIPCALLALNNIHWKLDIRPKSVALSLGVGLLGAAGQLILFEALQHGPAYIIFPVISCASVLTVILSAVFLKERVRPLGILGILFAFAAIICFSLTPSDGTVASGYLWLVLALSVFVCWGIQAFIMKLANNHTPDAESVFVYMAIAAVLLIPVALLMTDFSQPVNWKFNGPYLTFIIQILNAIGAYTLVYANRHGKAMVVAPLVDALAPLMTVIISLILYRHMPPAVQIAGIVCGLSGVFILSRE